MQINNIPEELRHLDQWMCSHADGIPISPKTGVASDVRDHANFGSLAEAIATGLPYIGFVLTEDDPYTFIDLDRPKTSEIYLVQQKILKLFDSYTEKSKSGNGYHIIIKGSVPSGVRKDGVEIYSAQRYMICTGSVVRASPVRNYHTIVNKMWEEMGGTENIASEERDSPMILADEAVLNMAYNAANSAKFRKLYEGKWEGSYPSQNEADYALMAMLAFYSPSNDQCVRIFRTSGLVRDKSYRADYLPRMLNSLRMNVPQLDTSVWDTTDTLISAQVAKEQERLEIETLDTQARDLFDTIPDGLLKEVTDYIYATSVRPIKEVSFFAALTFFAGIVGRQFNISGSGLNLYLILLAQSGVGKEGAASGINRLVSAIAEQHAAIHDFVGPAGFTSGSAIMKLLAEKHTMFSIFGEVGHTLNDMLHNNGGQSTHMSTLKRALLDLYHKSGRKDILHPTAYSDKLKTVAPLSAPAFTLFGESTPDIFYGVLSEALVADGMLPRFLILEYLGDRPAKNPNCFTPPSVQLTQQLINMLTTVLNMTVQRVFLEVKINPQAQVVLDFFDKKCDNSIVGSTEVVRNLWNRAHVQALRLSALFAVASNLHQPVVQLDHANFAIRLVEHCITALLWKFEKNQIGSGDYFVQQQLINYCVRYLDMDAEQRRAYRTNEKIIDEKVIPITYLKRMVLRRKEYVSHKMGAEAYLRQQLDYLCDIDALRLVPKNKAKEQWNMLSPVYVLGENWSSLM